MPGEKNTKRAPRAALTTKELSQLTAENFIRLKLTNDELLRLKEINHKRSIERNQRSALWRIEEEPIRIDLREVGWIVESVWDLVNKSTPYPEAIPTLLKHLKRPYSDRIREGIARALAVRDASCAWQILVEEYRKAPMGVKDGMLLGAKSGLAVALSVAATDDVIEELIALARDRSHGDSRLLLLSGLKKSKTAAAKEALKELHHDPALQKEISSWRKRA